MDLRSGSLANWSRRREGQSGASAESAATATHRPAARIDGERTVIEILDRMIARLQSLGYLPCAERRIVAKVDHSLTVPSSPEAMREEIGRLAAMVDGDAQAELLRLDRIAASVAANQDAATGGHEAER